MSAEKNVLAFMAHPDDAELCMGGTLARYAEAGYNTHIIVASIPDRKEERIAEAEEAAKILGAQLHFVLNEGAWQVEDIPVYALVRAFDEFVGKLSPHIIFTHWNEDTHHDHTLVSKAVLSSCRRLDVDLYMCEQPNLCAPVGGPFDANTFVDVSDFMPQRLAAIRAHRTQVAGRNYEEHVLLRAVFYGDRLGIKYAEAFKCVLQRLRF